MLKFLCCVTTILLCVTSVEAKRPRAEEVGIKKIKKLVNVESEIVVKESDPAEGSTVALPSTGEVKQKQGVWYRVISKIGSWFTWGSNKKAEDTKALANQKARERKEKNYDQEKSAKEARAVKTKDFLERSAQDAEDSKKEVKSKKQDEVSVAEKAARVVKQSREADRELQRAKDSGASPEEIQRLQSKAKKAFSRRMDSEKETKAAENRKLAAEGRATDKKDALGKAKKEAKKAEKALKQFNNENADSREK